MTRRHAAPKAVLAAALAALLAGCSGHGKYTTEGISLAEQRLNALKAATEHDMARQAFLAGDLDKALRRIDSALAIVDASASFHVVRGRVHIERGNMGEALLALRRAAEIDPRAVEARYYLGVVYERLGEPEAALEHFAAAAEIDPNNPQHVIAAGEMLVDLGRTVDAEAMLLASPSAGHAAGVQQLLGHLAMISGLPEQACDRFGRARLLAPDDGAILEDLALAQVAAARFAEAETTLRHLLADEANATRRDLLHMRGECLLAIDRPVEAREIYRRLADNQSDPAAWVGLGRASFVLGDERAVRRAASRAVSLDPALADGYVLWAAMDRDLGDPSSALARVDAGLRHAGPDADLLALREMLVRDLESGATATASAAEAGSAPFDGSGSDDPRP